MVLCMEALSSSVFVPKFSETLPVLHPPNSCIRSSSNKRTSRSLKFNQNFPNATPWASRSRVLALARELSDEDEDQRRFESNGLGFVYEKIAPSSQVKSESNKSLDQWDILTAKFSGASNIPFLLLQLPQILLNARNLLAGNKTALLAIPWLGMFTGLVGNLSLLSYFAKKRETEVVVVQTLGVVSIFVVIAQLAMAEAMPLPHFIITSIVVASGLVINFMNYFDLLSSGIWRFWEDFITVAGLSVLPQVMWSTFVPYIPNSILPGALAFVIAVAAVVMARMGKLSEKGIKFVGAISGWTATLLFMWMPVAQMWTNFLNPDNIKGLSALSMLLAMIGNGLMIPRALFIRDFMWFTGSTWASVFYGWGNLICLYCFRSISKEFFLAATAGLYIWIGIAFWRDTTVYGYSSPLTSIKELVFGR